MKRCVWILLLLFFLSSKSFSQTQAIQQLLLDVEKLTQLKSILTELKDGYKIVSNGYTTIKNISEDNFNLHDVFLKSLLEVTPAVKNYVRIKDIIDAQLSIVREYKNALKQFKGSGEFSVDEMGYLEKVYAHLFNHSLDNLQTMLMVITAGQLRMSDDERINSIDGVWKEVSQELTFLRHFNNQARILCLQRLKEKNDLSAMDQLYDVND
jgi:hypothetical protein